MKFLVLVIFCVQNAVSQVSQEAVDPKKDQKKIESPKSYKRKALKQKLLAEETNVEPTQGEARKQHWEVGLSYGYVKYREPGLMSEYGAMYGVVGSYFTELNNSAWFMRPEGELFTGHLTYDGQTQSGTPVKTTTDDSIMNLRFLIGVNFQKTESLFFRGYVGLAYRYLYDKIIGSGGYRREITYLYLPIGVEFEQAISKNWLLGVATEYDFFLSGRVKSYLSDVSSSAGDVENAQKKGYGARAKLVSTHRLSESLSLIVEPYVQYWEVEDSEKIRFTDGYYNYILYEPYNDSRMYGANVSLRIELQ